MEILRFGRLMVLDLILYSSIVFAFKGNSGAIGTFAISAALLFQLLHRYSLLKTCLLLNDSTSKLAPF